MQEQKEHTPIFGKDRKGADFLKVAYITFAILLATSMFVIPGTLPLWFTFIAIIGTGPIWNIIDGFVDDGEQWRAFKEGNKNKLHTLYNWFFLGFVSSFTLGLCLVAGITQFTALTAGTAVVLGIPIALMIGPIGGIAFAITMSWLAIKSYSNMRAFDHQIINAQEEEKNTLIKQRGYVLTDFCAWLSAAVGSSGLAVIACLALASIGFPPAIPIVFVGIVLLSATIKLYQMFFHPKTPVPQMQNSQKPFPVSSSSFSSHQSTSRSPSSTQALDSNIPLPKSGSTRANSN